ncbi:MAG: hypothetical protein AMXMBFR64_42640 [Myxococcales bacterium]
MRYALLTLLLVAPAVAHARLEPLAEVVELHQPASPLVSVRLMLSAGSVDDPTGKEGLAALTGLMVGAAGTKKRPYKELTEALYPMAASLQVATDREVTVVSGEVHKDKLDAFTELLVEAVTQPGFMAEDLERNRERLLSALTTGLRSGSDELLGLEAIQGVVFRGHPYEKPPEGTVAGLRAITADDVRGFHHVHFVQRRLMIGVAGGYPEGYPQRLAVALAGLPAGEPRPSLPPGPAVSGRRVTIIDKATASVGIHVAHPLGVTRSDPDFVPLLVASSWLGEHRTFHGILMRELRGERGLNYGDYTYVEHWADPPATSHPTPNRPRSRGMFSIWVRPVAPKNAHFALRAALHFVDEAVKRGISQEELDATRDFLTGYSKLWAQTGSRRLGFLMDSRFHGTPPWLDHLEARLRELTPAEVNAAMRKHLHVDGWEAVIVSDKAAALAEALRSDAQSPITYEADVPERVRRADAVIQGRALAPLDVRVVPVGELFER